jgi:hypothetical protein
MYERNWILEKEGRRNKSPRACAPARGRDPRDPKVVFARNVSGLALGRVVGRVLGRVPAGWDATLSA